MKIGILREGKTPPDKRVAFTPDQCVEIQQKFPQLNLVVQKSEIRAFPDTEYAAKGVTLVDSVADCDVIVGVKEVPIPELIPNKKYFFFSHTFKQQPYNRDLLQAVVDKNIELIDYEVLVGRDGKRIIGFGKYAGIVGAYNGILAFGKKAGLFSLKPANKCFDRAEMEQEYAKVSLPKNFKLVMTGAGRVAGGAMEVFNGMGIKKVSPQAFLNEEFDGPVYTQILVTDYNIRKDGAPFKRREFFADPVPYKSNFLRFAKVADVYTSCHYWDHRSPIIISREDFKNPDLKLKVVSDISCDIDCAVGSTLRPSTIADPLYGYDPITEKEVDFMADGAIGVMAVDNLPCELPRDASGDFGREFIDAVLPELVNGDPDRIIAKATETRNGDLTPEFEYLRSYLEGKA